MASKIALYQNDNGIKLYIKMIIQKRITKLKKIRELIQR